MNDNTDKLAAQMQNLRPSKVSRESGMDAAMAAFNKEFASDAAVETNASKAASSEKLDKKIESTQGLTDEPRPTGQTTKTVRVTTRRVETMTKVKNLFNLKSQTMMMAGSCAAALIAAMIVLPNMDELSDAVPSAVSEAVTIKQAAKDSVGSLEQGSKTVDSGVTVKPQAREEIIDEIVVTGRRPVEADKAQNDVPLGEETEAPAANDLADSQAVPPGNPLPSPASPPQSGIGSISSLLTPIRQNAAKIEAENRSRVRQFVGQTPPPPPQIERQSAAIKPSNSNPRAAIPGRTRIVIPSSGSGAQAPTSGPEKIGGLTLEEVPGTESITETVVVQPASV